MDIRITSRSRKEIKVLVIMGSPRKRNTTRIVEEIENGKKKLSDVEVFPTSISGIFIWSSAGGVLYVFSKGRDPAT